MRGSFVQKKRIYLDYNATTPPAEFLKDQWKNWLNIYGNPSSVHQAGQVARALFWSSKQYLADFIGCHPLELIAVSGGSEANNAAIKGLYHKYFPQNLDRKEIIISAVEHSSVRASVQYLEKKGMKIQVIPVSKNGQLDLSFYRSILSKQTFLVSIMYANNETGHIFPISRLSQLARQAGALFHCDMVQALGKIPLNLKDLEIDTASFSAHKFYALKGLGILYCRKGIRPDNLIHGGPQERQRRAGTENTLGMACLGAVAQRGKNILSQFSSIKTLRDQMEEDILSKLPDAQIIGANSKRLYNTSSIYVPNVEGETVLMNMDLKGYSFSVGSACHSGSINPSSVLLGMGFTEKQARSTFRISLGLNTRLSDLKSFVKDLVQSIQRIRKFQ